MGGMRTQGETGRMILQFSIYNIISHFLFAFWTFSPI